MKKIKSIICSLVAGTMLLSCMPAAVMALTDVQDSAIERVKGLSIMTGDPDGEFRPYYNITRAESAAVIGRVMGIDGAVTDDTGFVDVADGSFASGYIKELSACGIIIGVGDGMFEPDSNVTYNDFAVMLTRVLSYNIRVGESPLKIRDMDKSKAQVLNSEDELMAGVSVSDYSLPLERADAAVMINNALDIPILLYIPQQDEYIRQDGQDGRKLYTLAVKLSEAANEVNTADGNNTFAMNLNNTMDKSSNYMFSPLSVKMALAMAANGANGDTESEIEKVLCIDSLKKYNNEAKELIEYYSEYGFDYDEYNALAKKFNQGTATEDEIARYSELSAELNRAQRPLISIANSIWVNKDYNNDIGYKPEFKPDFQKIAEDYYSAECETVGKDDAVKRINDWTAAKTNNKITEIVSDNNFLAALVNAIYFKAKWQNEFSAEYTHKDSFKNADGTVTQTDFMNRVGYYNYYSDDDVKMIGMPYSGGTTAMYISVDNGDIDDYDKYFSRLENNYIDLSIPKFRVEYTEDLGKKLQTLGINKAFNASLADFNKMFGGVPDSENVYIDKILHKTYIDVDEKGTEAAAVTAVMMAGSALPPEPTEFKANQPFTFMIRDEKSGEVIFMGRVARFDK